MAIEILAGLKKLVGIFSKFKAAKEIAPAEAPPAEAVPAAPPPAAPPAEAPPAAPAVEAIPEVAVAEKGMKALKGVGETGKKVAAGAKKWAPTVFKIILVLAVLIVIVLWSRTATGSVVKSEAGGMIAPMTDALREFGAPMNQFWMILTGEYDPTQLWTSKTYEDRYATIEDIGVKISNLRPLRDPFLDVQELAILGNLKVASLPEEEEGTSATISASWVETNPLVPDTRHKNWDCNGEDPGNKLEISGTRLYIGRFMCTHNAISVPEETTESHTAKIKVEYSFSMKAGKQVYIADYEQMGVLLFEEQDPMKFFGITKEQVKSWQTESPVGLGLGILGEEEILTANAIRYDEEGKVIEKYNLWHYIGVTVENRAPGKVIGLEKEDLTLTLPDTIEVADPTDPKHEDMDFTPVSEKTIDGVKLITYQLKKGTGIRDEDNKRLESGEFKTYFLKFRAWDEAGPQGQPDFLQGAPISSFFILSELKFDYKDAKSVAIKIKSL